jgi:hypothetical protein
MKERRTMARLTFTLVLVIGGIVATHAPAQDTAKD